MVTDLQLLQLTYDTPFRVPWPQTSIWIGGETFVDMGISNQSRGNGTGIAFALHVPFGRHFFVGFDRDQPLPKDPLPLSRSVADLQLCTVLAHEAALRALSPEHQEPQCVTSLTPREPGALRWTMEGKTAQEVGKTLSIEAQTANQSDPQAGRHQQASDRAEGAASRPHPLNAHGTANGVRQPNDLAATDRERHARPSDALLQRTRGTHEVIRHLHRNINDSHQRSKS